MKKVHKVTEAEFKSPSYTYGRQPKYATACGMAASKQKATTDIARVTCEYCRRKAGYPHSPITHGAWS